MAQNEGVSYRDRDNAYYHKHAITGEHGLKVLPPNVINSAQNVIAQIFPALTGKEEIVTRVMQNCGNAVIYVLIAEYSILGVSNADEVPNALQFHFLLYPGGTLDCSKHDQDVYANCPTAAMVVSTFQMNRE